MPKLSPGGDRNACAMSGRGEDLDEFTVQIERSGVGDPGGCQRADAQRFVAREVDEFVLAGTPREDSGIAFARSLDDDLLDPADTGTVSDECRALDDHPEAGEPLSHGCGIAVSLDEVGGFGQLLVFGFDYVENPQAWRRSLELLSKEVMPKVQHLKPGMTKLAAE